MIPKIIHQIWLGDPMGEKVRAWVASVGRHNPDWSHIVWNEAMLLVIGIDAKRLRAIFGNWASATNLIRLILLDKFGGVYLDTDFECLAGLQPFLSDDFGIVARAAEQDGGRICNACLVARQDDPWIRWQLANFYHFPPNDAASGVYLATAAPQLLVYRLPQQWVYPWMYDTPPEQRRLTAPLSDQFLIHHWEGSWTK